jgi:iron complex outermembrane recepter protein
MSMERKGCCRFLVPLALFALAPLTGLAQSLTFNLPAQPLAESLKAIGAQTGLNIMVSPPLVDGKQAPALKANLSAKDALARVLSGTKLEYHFVNDQTVVIRERGQALAVTYPPPGSPANPPTQDNIKEAGKESSQDFRVAQTTLGQTQGDVPINDRGDSELRHKASQIEEIIVTGSRLPPTAAVVAQPVNTYTREDLERSGQTTVGGFLNTLPEIGVSIGENGIQTFRGATTVQLHGLPIGSTLVLLNGRRLEASGSQGGQFFDLNNIPASAIERIDVLLAGSSAIYGSDAIAGVVNIILRSDFDGLEADLGGGKADDINEGSASIAWGTRTERGEVSIIGSYLARGELEGFDRALTATDDKTPFGGNDNQLPICNPGTVFSLTGSPLPGAPPGSSATTAAVSPTASGNPRQTGFQGTYGAINYCNVGGYSSLIPSTRRGSIFGSGHYSLSTSVELFGELMFSHVEQLAYGSPPFAFAVPGYSQYTVSPNNPYNPFGTGVGIGYLFSSVGRQPTTLATQFLRPVLGLRGALPDDWHWEVSISDSQDRSSSTIEDSINPTALQDALNSSNLATALNVFVPGAPGSPQAVAAVLETQLSHYNSRTDTLNGFVRGPIAQLPSGKIELVVGAEYDRDSLSPSDSFGDELPGSNYTRRRSAVFGEMRVPLLAGTSDSQSWEEVSLSVAGRYDRYSDFGSSTTPQVGLELRPIPDLLIRSTYGKAFQAPTLISLYQPTQSFASLVTDPRDGQLHGVTLTTGGNPQLLPETGRSFTAGFVYSRATLPNLTLTGTYWHIRENENIQTLPADTIAANPSLFPGRVTRAPDGTLIAVDDTVVNFGAIDVSGIDYQFKYVQATRIGDFTPTLNASQTLQYTGTLVPGAPATNRLSQATDDGNWAPRWKASAALAWGLGPWSATAVGRYIGKYIDYDSTHTIGDFWLFDTSLRYLFGASSGRLKQAHVELGAVNLFNRQPQYSNFDFGGVGYDPAQADIRGRFIYLRVGAKL